MGSFRIVSAQIWIWKRLYGITSNGKLKWFIETLQRQKKTDSVKQQDLKKIWFEQSNGNGFVKQIYKIR